jgi:hypothetical protein
MERPDCERDDDDDMARVPESLIGVVAPTDRDGRVEKRDPLTDPGYDRDEIELPDSPVSVGFFILSVTSPKSGS